MKIETWFPSCRLSIQLFWISNLLMHMQPIRVPCWLRLFKPSIFKLTCCLLPTDLNPIYKKFWTYAVTRLYYVGRCIWVNYFALVFMSFLFVFPSSPEGYFGLVINFGRVHVLLTLHGVFPSLNKFHFLWVQIFFAKQFIFFGCWFYIMKSIIFCLISNYLPVG